MSEITPSCHHCQLSPEIYGTYDQCNHCQPGFTKFDADSWSRRGAGPQQYHCGIPRDRFDAQVRTGATTYSPAIGRFGSAEYPQKIGPRPCHTCPRFNRERMLCEAYSIVLTEGV